MWLTIEKEAFAIFYALQKLVQSLHDSEFVIRTDHKPVRYIMDSPVQYKEIYLGPQTSMITTVRLNTQKVRSISVLICCHAFHIDHQIVIMMMMNLVALI